MRQKREGNKTKLIIKEIKVDKEGVVSGKNYGKEIEEVLSKYLQQDKTCIVSIAIEK